MPVISQTIYGLSLGHIWSLMSSASLPLYDTAVEMWWWMENAAQRECNLLISLLVRPPVHAWCHGHPCPVLYKWLWVICQSQLFGEKKWHLGIYLRLNSGHRPTVYFCLVVVITKKYLPILLQARPASTDRGLGKWYVPDLIMTCKSMNQY